MSLHSINTNGGYDVNGYGNGSLNTSSDLMPPPMSRPPANAIVIDRQGIYAGDNNNSHLSPDNARADKTVSDVTSDEARR